MLTKLVSFIFLFLFRIRFPRFQSIAFTFRLKYNNHTLTTFRSLEKVSRKLIKTKLDLRFLNICLTQKVFPKFLRFKLYRSSLHETELYRSWQNTLLEKEIDLKQQQLTSLHSQKQTLLTHLKDMISFLDFHSTIAFLNRSLSKIDQSVKKTHDKKLFNLGATLHTNNLDPTKVIFNLSDRVLSARQSFILSFGLNFGLPNFKPKFSFHYSLFEAFARKLKTEPSIKPFSSTLDLINDTANTLFKKANNFSRDFIFSKADFSLLKDLKNDKSILITRPDKGRGVVILNTADYKQKLLSILQDFTKFEKLDSHTDPHKLVLKHEDRIHRFLRHILSLNIITKDQYNFIKPVGSSLGVMYGLPKVHKISVPLRPILAAYNSPSYTISKFLVPLLEPYTTNQYTIKNSYSFYEFLSDQNFNRPVHMVSYDITSLFTSIPLAETINIAVNKVFQDCTLFHGFSRSTFTNLLNLACKDIHFLFDGTIYRQVDGVAMGSPLGPTMANLFMAHYENIWLNNCPSSYKPLIYKRYVDDTFTCFSDPSHSESFLEYLNGNHPNIKFTKETAVDNSIPFLDLNVSFCNGKFNTGIYRKPTFTGLGSNFHGFIFSKFKLNSIKTLLHRAYHLSSNFNLFHNEILFLREYFSNNGYPLFIFDDYLRLFLDKIYSNPTPIANVPKKVAYISLPFYGTKSEGIYKKLFNSLSDIYPHLNLKPILKTKLTIQSFFPFKDRIPDVLRSNIVYKYECCCNATYIGSTVRRAVERFTEHLGKSFRTNRPVTNPPLSHIRDHAVQSKHPLSINNFKIIDSTNNRDVLTIESLNILFFNPTLNIQHPSNSLLLSPAEESFA